MNHLKAKAISPLQVNKKKKKRSLEALEVALENWTISLIHPTLP